MDAKSAGILARELIAAVKVCMTKKRKKEEKGKLKLKSVTL